MDTATILNACECGCGTPINQRLLAVMEAQTLGTKYKELAERLGCSVPALRSASRQVARFVNGHQAKKREWHTRDCIECGESFRVPMTATRQYCKKRYCVSGSLAYYQAQGGPEQFDHCRESENKQRRINHAETLGRLYTESREARVRAKRAIAKGYRPGPNIPTLAEQLAECDEQIRALYEEQIRDARRDQIQYAASSDRRFDADDDGSWLYSKMGMVWFDREDDMWPYFAGMETKSRTRAST